MVLKGVGIGSLAEQAGSRKYDLITEMNGKYLNPDRFYSELLTSDKKFRSRRSLRRRRAKLN
jgi:S1-C subfamily serine protease